MMVGFKPLERSYNRPWISNRGILGAARAPWRSGTLMCAASAAFVTRQPVATVTVAGHGHYQDYRKKLGQ